MAEIGSTVIYSGKILINAVHGTQPVWGVKKSATDDEKADNATVGAKKLFADYLKEEIEQQKNKS